MVAPFQDKFEPVVRVGENLRLMPEDRYFSVDFIEGIPWLEHDNGAMTATQEDKDVELTEAYEEDNQLSQLRMTVIDTITITGLKQPRGVPKWVTKKFTATLPQYSSYGDYDALKRLQLTEFFQFEDTGLFADIRCDTTTSTSRVVMFGYRFVLREIQKPPVFTTLWTQGYMPPRK